MSNSVDKRIVEMEFDNQQFENNVQTSVKSLENLKKGLNLDESAKKLSNLNEAGNKFSLANISAGVDAIASKFTTLGIIGVTALQNITNSAINAGKQIVKSLTIEPIMQGFNEYETKIGAITTILTNTKSKGTTLDQVNDALGELNKYADLTIYDFTEMTKNIGTFTAAGVGLKTSVNSIKGIANLAAGSGSSAMQASTAMYQLSQAIAAGSVKLQDWNSVVNAGMGGELFQKALEDTAKSLGKGRNMAVSFRESLESGWITTEVLTKTLEKFANDESLLKAATQVKTFTQLFDTMKESVQSGWAVSWEYIVGDSDQAAKVLTNLSDAFNNLISPSADARNAMLKFWNENGGRDAIIVALTNSFKALGNILKPIKEAFGEVFPPMTGEKLVEFSNKLKNLTDTFKISDKTVYNIKATFKGLFSIVDIGVQAFKSLSTGLGNLIKYFLPASDGLLDLTGNIGNLFTNLDATVKKTDIFNTAIKGMGNVLKSIGDVIKAALTKISSAFTGFNSIDFSIFGALAGIANIISKAFNKMKDVVSNAMQNLGFDNVLDVINGGLLAAILIGVKKFIGNLTEITSNGTGILGGVKDILEGVKGSLESYQNSLKANTLLKIGAAIGILAASILVLSTIDPKKLASSLTAMSGLFAELFGSLTVFEKILGSSGFKSVGKITTAMIGLSTAVLILSVAMKKLGGLNWNQIAKGLTAVGILMTELVSVSLVLSNNSGKMVKGSVGLVLFSTSILVLSNAVSKLGSIDISSLTKGLVSVGVLLTELSLFLNLTNFDNLGVLKGTGILLLATSINVLAKAVGAFTEMDVGKMIQGLAAVGVVLSELAVFVNLTGNAKHVISTAIGLTILGSAMLIFANAVSSFGNMSWETLGKGLLGMAGALTVVIAALYAIPKNILVTASSLLVISAALVVLSNALQNMGGMSWESIGKGLVVLAGSLTIIAIAMAAMTGALPGAAALLIVSGALMTLTPVLLALGSMSWESIAKGLVMLAGTFAVFGVSAALLTPVIPAMLGVAAAIALLSVGVLAAGAGLLALSTGITALAVAFGASGVVIIAAIESLLGLIPTLATKIGEGVVTFIKSIGDGSTAIIDAVTKIILGILQAIINNSSKLFEAATTIILGIIQVIEATAPKVIEAIFVILEALSKEIIDFSPKMSDAGMKILIGFLNGIANNIGEVVASGVSIISNFLLAIGQETPKVVDAGFNMMIDFINGLADSIRENTPLLIKATQNLMDAVIRAGLDILTGGIFGFSKAGNKNMEDGYIKGMRDKKGDSDKTALDIAKSAVDNFGSKVKELYNTGVDAVLGFVAGMGSKIKAVSDKAWELGQKAVIATKNALDSHSPSRVFMVIGEQIGEGMAIGVNNGAEEAINSSSDMAKEIIAASQKDIKDFQDWLEDKKYYNQISMSEELAAWQLVQAKYIEGTEERKKADQEVYRLYTALNKESFDNSKKWIDEEKYYNRLSLEDELTAWERIQARYLEGSEERKEADKQVYTLRNSLAKESYEASKKWIDEEAEGLADKLAGYRRISVKENLTAEQREENAKNILALEKEISEVREKYIDDQNKILDDAAKKRIELEDDYKDKVLQVNNQLKADIKSLDDAYADAIDSRADSLYKSYGLFDKVTKADEVSGTELMDNLQSQVDAFKDWEKDINSLASKGLNQGLIDELQEMGPQSAAQIKALNSLSDSQLAQYANLWAEKHEEAKDRAVDELEDLRVETQSQIKALTAQSKIDLAELYDTWQENLDDLNLDTTKQLKELKATFDKQIGFVKQTTEEDIATMATNVKTIMEQAGWDESGQKIITGLNKGLVDNKGTLFDTIISIGNTLISTFNQTIDSHSPSRVFAKIGGFIVKGLAVGLTDNASIATDATKNVAKEAISTMSKTIASISNVVDEDMAIQPTIRPVIDLTDVMNGANQINGALNANRSLVLGAVVSANQNGSISQAEQFAEIATQSNSKIVDAIVGLKEDFAALVAQVGQLQVVMDTGTLVGAISPEMDKSLGRRSVYKGRGI